MIRHRPSPPTERAHRRGERGESLVEVLVTVVIMSIAVIGVIASLWTLARTSDAGRRSSRASVEAINQAEALLTLPYTACATPSTYRTSAFTTANPLPAGYTATLTMRYLSTANPAPVADATVGTAGFQDTCPGTDQGIQELTVTVTAGRAPRQVVRSMTVLKRNNTCASTTFTGYVAGQKC